MTHYQRVRGRHIWAWLSCVTPLGWHGTVRAGRVVDHDTRTYTRLTHVASHYPMWPCRSVTLAKGELARIGRPALTVSSASVLCLCLCWLWCCPCACVCMETRTAVDVAAMRGSASVCVCD